jgi:pyruvate dehydrogenase E1 component beta subunit
MRNITLTQAVNEALQEEMRRDASVYVLGHGLYWGFGGPGVTSGLREEFGESRVRTTPISEPAITGSCVGAALAGMRPVAQLGLADFVFGSLDEIMSKAGKWRYTHGANGGMKLPIVFLETIGGYVSGASEHSQAPLGLYWHAPGLKIAVPTTHYDAKGLLKRPSATTTRPLLHATTPHGRRGPVPEEDFRCPLGAAEVRQEGRDVTVVATAYMGRWRCAADALSGRRTSRSRLSIRARWSRWTSRPSSGRCARPGGSSWWTKTPSAAAWARRSAPRSWSGPSTR